MLGGGGGGACVLFEVCLEICVYGHDVWVGWNVHVWKGVCGFVK